MNSRMKEQRRRRNGSALMIVMFVSGILVITGIAMTFVTSNASHLTRKRKMSAQALALAEAGIAHSVSALLTNYEYWANNTNTGSIMVGGQTGTYQVITKLYESGNILMTSVGTVEENERTTVLELLGTQQDENTRRYLSGGAIMTKDWFRAEHPNIEIYGSVLAGDEWRMDAGTIYGGDAIAGRDIRLDKPSSTLNGNAWSGRDLRVDSGQINGDADATASIRDDYGNISGAKVTGVPQPPSILLPEFDFDAYRQAAIDDGMYFEGDQSFGNSTVHMPNNGIVFVNGKCEYGNNSEVYGCVVATDEIRIKNRLLQVQVVSNMPALLSQGDIRLENRNVYHGAMWAGGYLRIDNHRSIYGPLFAHGFIRLESHNLVDPGGGIPLWNPTNPPTQNQLEVGGWLQ